MTDLIPRHPSTFYDHLFAESKSGYVTISILDQTRLGEPHAWTDTIETVRLGGPNIGDEIAGVVDAVVAGGPARNVYFAPAPRRSPKRGHVGNTAALTALWAEFDSPASSPTKNPSASFANIGEVNTLFFDQGMPEPSIQVASGNGWHCYWPLDEPIPWDDVAADLLARWGTFIIGRAARKDKYVDRVFDAARVLRCPGTYNHKHDPPALVEIVSMNGYTFSYNDLDDLLPPLDEGSKNLWSTTHDISGLTDGAITEWIDSVSGIETNAEGRKRVEAEVAKIKDAASGGRHDLTFSALALLIQDTRGHRAQVNVAEALSILHYTFTEAKPDADPSEYRNMVRYLVGQRIRETEEKAKSGLDVLGLPREAKSSLYVDWHALADDEGGADQFLVPGLVLYRGLNTLQSQAGVGKSFVTIAICLGLATGQSVLGFPHPTGKPIRVAYFDWEMSPADLRDRVYSLGYDLDDDDLSAFHYLLYPGFALNTAEGAGEMLDLIIADDIEVAVFDTMSRAVTTPENSDEGWREAMRLAWTPLKQLGVTTIRLDHLGKQKKLGGRGSSTKRDEADLIWNMTKTKVSGDDGQFRVTFKMNKGRVLVPSDKLIVAWRIGERGLVSFTADQSDPIFTAPPAGVAEIIAAMDAAKLPPETGRRAARLALKWRGSDALMMEAVRQRKEREQDREKGEQAAREHVRAAKEEKTEKRGEAVPRRSRAGVSEPEKSSTTKPTPAAREDARAGHAQPGQGDTGAEGESFRLAPTRRLTPEAPPEPLLCPSCGETAMVPDPRPELSDHLVCQACDVLWKESEYPYGKDDDGEDSSAAEDDRPPPPHK